MNRLFIGLIGALTLFSRCQQAETKEQHDTGIHDGMDSLAHVLSQIPETPKPNEVPDGYFRAPVDGPLSFSGTFCELRNNHFHSGLDIRTGGQEGMEVKSVAEGQVVRIRIGPTGLGKALYVAHPNGITSVYAHLKYFNEEIEAFAREAQYKNQKYEVELYPPAGRLKVEKGSVIAYSGNTGGSAGPHLHFELRSSRTEHALNAMDYGIQYADSLPPKVFKMAVYRIDDNARAMSGRYPVHFFDPDRQGQLNLPPGNYSFAYYGNDYGNDYQFKFGINEAKLFSNDQLQFRMFIDHLNFAKTRYINHHFDYYTFKATGVRYVKLYREESNALSYYSDKVNGQVVLSHGDTLNIRLEVRDHKGHLTTKRFKVRCLDAYGFPASATRKYKGTPYRSMSSVQNSQVLEACKWDMEPGTFYFDFDLFYRNEVSTNSKYLSAVHHLHEDLLAMHSAAKLSIKPNAYNGVPVAKLCLVNAGQGGAYVGGTWQDGWVTANIKNLGAYAVSIDTIPPRIRYLGKSGSRLRFSVSDNLSGVKSWDAWINGKWFLLEYEPKSALLFGTPDKALKGEKLSLRVLVKDDRNNSSELNQTIIY